MSSVAVDLVELADDWLDYKRLREDDRQTLLGNSDRARRCDLARWARLILIVTGRPVPDMAEGLDHTRDLASCTLSDLNYETLTRSLATARSGSFAPSSIRRMMSTLRGFTRWLNARGHIATDPCADDVFTLPRMQLPTPRSITPEQVEQMLEAAETIPARARQGWWPARDRCIIALLAYCGLRAGEACSAKMSWVDRRTERPMLRVLGKGSKHRDVPVPSRAMSLIGIYHQERRDRGLLAGTDPNLLVRTNGSPLPYPSLDRIVRGLAQRAGVPLPEGAAAHSLRHSYGTELALRGVNVTIAAQLMGHSDVKTTMRYQMLAARELIAVLDDAGLL